MAQGVERGASLLSQTSGSVRGGCTVPQWDSSGCSNPTPKDLARDSSSCIRVELVLSSPSKHHKQSLGVSRRQGLDGVEVLAPATPFP